MAFGRNLPSDIFYGLGDRVFFLGIGVYIQEARAGADTGGYEQRWPTNIVLETMHD